METTLSEHDLEATLSDVLDRVSDGQRFLIERNGEQIAVLSPLPESVPGVTGKDLIDRLGGLRMPGDGYADDIETARASLRPVPPPQWPD